MTHPDSPPQVVAGGMRPGGTAPGPTRGRGIVSVLVFLGVAALVSLVCRPLFSLSNPGGLVAAWSTVFLAVVVQALPFLALGVVVSGLIDAFVPDWLLQRVVPRRVAVAVPVAAAAGALLPGCECASVPVAARLMRRGIAPATAIAFLLAAPAINPVVLVATAVAFPHRPGMVAARFVASLVTAATVGWLWPRFGRPLPPRVARLANSPRGWPAFVAAVRHDLFQSGGFLVIGAGASAMINVAAPSSWLHLAASNAVVAVAALAVLAVLLCVCSEADAFVASSLISFPPAAQLAFMVVGPAVDLKLVAMQVGAFGRPFATRLAPLSFVVAVTSSVLVGLVLL